MQDGLTEEQVANADSVQVKIGGIEYEIRPLKLVESDKWHRGFLAAVTKALELKSKASAPEEQDVIDINDLYAGLFIDCFSEIVRLVKLYAPYLSDAIDASATRKDILACMQAIKKLETYPTQAVLM